jgi:hypothetical protein
MPWPCRTTQASRKCFFDHEYTAVVGIHIGDRRIENDVSRFTAAEVFIAPKISRVLAKILARPELSWIHKNAHDNDICMLASDTHKGTMAFMEITHRGHEPDSGSLGA